MRRPIALLAAGMLVLGACTADDPTVEGPPGAEEENGAGEDGDVSGPGNEPPPEVEPSMLEPGESTAIGTEVVARSTDPSEDISRPRVVLVRNRDAGRRAAENAPTEGAAEVLRGWDRYAQRALLAVYGGAQPDSGHRVRLENVSLTRGGRHLTVFGAIVSRQPASQVISVPWVVLSVPANLVALAERCILALEGQTAQSRAC